MEKTKWCNLLKVVFFFYFLAAHMDIICQHFLIGVVSQCIPVVELEWLDPCKIHAELPRTLLITFATGILWSLWSCKNQLFCIQDILYSFHVCGVHSREKDVLMTLVLVKGRVHNKHSSRGRSGVPCRILSSGWIIIAVLLLQWKSRSCLKVS